MPAAARRRPLNPLLRRRIDRSAFRKSALALAAGFPHYPDFYLTIRSDTVSATPLLVARLQRLADAVGFPREDIFLDEPIK